MFWNRKKKLKEPIIHTVYRTQLKFIDTYGVEHKGPIFKYCDPETLNCSMEEYFFDEINNDNYVLERGTRKAYPLSQIASYWLEIIYVKKIYPQTHEIFQNNFKTLYSDEEVAESEVKE